ncbi:conserved hypothetical protein [Methanococcus vannielii SB]|uniref:Exosortase EpsH-related protein n=1 Tax=Methanococcus vannielii (strain ATCC 35089 / DSM 1224 / JCM 13029 / OCM 148 / SB) TaxID=406327 RepID=A6UPD3_METVS|nr:archaeosortase family protein ArtE [Methanococcus vannielii]ABR54355.1 conserved hypothetical protein [Methanococcus vannielii SB]
MEKINKSILLLKFMVSSISIYFIIMPLESFLIYPIAYQSHFILNLIGYSSLDGNLINLSNISIMIVKACTSVTTISILLGFVFSVSKSIKEFIFGGIFCTGIIYTGNIIRIVITSILANHFGMLSFFHDFVGYISTLILAVITVFAWLKFQKQLHLKSGKDNVI